MPAGAGRRDERQEGGQSRHGTDSTPVSQAWGREEGLFNEDQQICVG